MKIFNSRLATKEYQPKSIMKLGSKGSLYGKTGTQRNFNHENPDRSK